MGTPTCVILIVCLASIALGDDLKTISGQEYKRVKVTRVEPDGIVIIHKTGVTKLRFSELPPEVQQQFGYGPAKIEAKSPAAKTVEEKVERAEQQKKPEQTKPTLFIKAIALVTGVIAPMTHGVWIVFVIAVGLFLYFVPSMVGLRKTDAVAIFVFNFFLGWTFLGWVLALVWACTKDPVLIPLSGDHDV
jgi:hypothetical protein